MNIKERLRHLAEVTGKDRGFGRTTLLAKLTKETGGILLTHNHDYALNLKRKHGIEARSIETNLEGISGPYFVDHFAMETMFQKAANKIESVEEELNHAKATINNQNTVMDMMKEHRHELEGKLLEAQREVAKYKELLTATVNEAMKD